VLTVIAEPEGAARGVDLRVRGPLRRPAGESETGISRERLSSYREPASDEPTDRAQEDLFGDPAPAPRFAFCPFAPRVRRSYRTSSRLAPFDHPRTLRPAGVKDARRVQPMSATQTNCVYPHLVCSRLALATCAAGTPHGVLGSVRHDRGTERFTTPDERFGGPASSTNLAKMASRLLSRARALSSRGANAIEPLTPLSRPDCHPRASPAFARAAVLAVASAFGLGTRVGGCVWPPRPPMSAPRERNTS
jgi:hypothetical protein